MIRKKLCMVGAFAVGKTSLVQRYVSSIYTEKYHTTVGVKVDKKIVPMNEHPVHLLLWDLAGEDMYAQLNMAYLRGMAGYVLVVDGTRRATLTKGIEIVRRCREQYPQAFALAAMNKLDLQADWEVTETDMAELRREGVEVYLTSAKTAQSVDELFARAAHRAIVDNV